MEIFSYICNQTNHTIKKMNKRLNVLMMLTILCIVVQAQSVNLNDWTIKTDGSQYEWVTDKYQWGKTYFTANGIVNSEEIRVNRMKRQDGDDLTETYTFTNISKHKVMLKNIGIYTPFNDNYPDASSRRTIPRGRV